MRLALRVVVASLVCVPAHSTCLQLESGDQTIELAAWGPDAILLTVTPLGAAMPPAEYPSALLPRDDVSKCSSSSSSSSSSNSNGAGESAVFVHGNLRASLDAATGLLWYRRVSDGALLLREKVRRTFAASTCE